jgi:hypothetical protein
VPINPATITNFSDPKEWRASTNDGGSPGVDDPVSTLRNPDQRSPHARRAAAGAHRIYNASANPVDIGGWYLTDDRHTPRVPHPRQHNDADQLVPKISATAYDANPGVPQLRT